MSATAIQNLPVDGIFPDRATYGAQNPAALGPFDPTQNVRNWILKGKIGPTVLSFTPTDPNASELVQQTFDGASLAFPNLMGAPSFEQYDAPATTAITWGASLQTSFPPQYLSTRTDAQKVATAIGGTLVNGVDYYKPFGITFGSLGSSDALQPWMITGAGNPAFAGPMVTAMYAKGKGAPGEFVQAPSGAWGWVATPIDDGNDGKPHPVQAAPVVPFDVTQFKLSSDPALTGQPMTILGAPLMIVPINASPSAPASSPGSSDGFTAADRTLLQQIARSPILGVGV